MKKPETAIAAGEISEADLFDRDYVPLPDTDPKQYLSRCLAATDRLLPSIQEPLLEFDPRVVFSMGGGVFVMMKDASAPIYVNGRHWGGLRLAYRV